MHEYPFYGIPVSNTFSVHQPTVDDLVAWLLSLPPDARVQTDAEFRYDYRSNELTVRQVDAL